MSIWPALAGGFVGTLVLTTILRAGSELRMTRMDLPFLLGTAVTADRLKAKAVGYILHFFFGQLFALGYYGLFLALGRADWILGGLFGLGHGLFAGSALVNILLPLVHPRMGTGMSSAGQTSAPRATRVPDAQLRPPDAARQPGGARGIWRDPRRLCRVHGIGQAPSEQRVFPLEHWASRSSRSARAWATMHKRSLVAGAVALAAAAGVLRKAG